MRGRLEQPDDVIDMCELTHEGEGGGATCVL